MMDKPYKRTEGTKMSDGWMNFFATVGITAVTYLFVFGFLPLTEAGGKKRDGRRKRK